MKLLEFDESQIGNPTMVQVLKQIDKHALETNQRLSSIEIKMDNISNAFPSHDFDGHRRYHQSLIDLLEARRKFYMSMKEKTIFGLLWAVLVWVGFAVWHEFLSLVQK